MSNNQKQFLSLNNFSVRPCSWQHCLGTSAWYSLASVGLALAFILSTLGNPLVANEKERDDTHLGSTINETTAVTDSKNDALKQLEHLKTLIENGDSNDSDLRSDLARAYQDAGLYEEALEQFLWCFDEGPKYAINDTWSGVRISFLLGYIQDLAEVYPPAMDALVERRDSLFRAIQYNDSAYLSDRA